MNLSGFKNILRAFEHRNYRLYFIGQFISLTGTWMTRIASLWLVYRLTGSPFFLGLSEFAGQLPIFILSPLAGLLIDRWNRQHVLVLTQTLSMIQSFALAYLALTGVIQVWHIVLLNLAQGIVDSFDLPSRQSIIIDLVNDRAEDLGNAIALNSSLVNATRMIGPAIAGLLLTKMGEGSCFLLDAISYIPVIGALLAISIRPKEKKETPLHIRKGLKEGLRYVFHSAPIRSILILLGAISFMGMPFRTLLPAFIQDVLHKGPHTLGFIMAVSGLGAFVGAIYLAARKSVVGLMKRIAGAAVIFGISLIFFALSRTYWLSILMSAVMGFCMLVCIAASNTILQTIVDENKRAQVMSFYSMAFLGMLSFGNMWAGFVAHEIGVTKTLGLGGLCCVVAGWLFIRELPKLRKVLRPLYIQMGILQPPPLA